MRDEAEGPQPVKIGFVPSKNFLQPAAAGDGSGIFLKLGSFRQICRRRMGGRKFGLVSSNLLLRPVRRSRFSGGVPKLCSFRQFAVAARQPEMGSFLTEKDVPDLGSQRRTRYTPEIGFVSFLSLDLGVAGWVAA
jgi:hypothetical protein